MNPSAIKTSRPNSRSSVTGWPENQPASSDSTVARYQRVAVVEAVLSVRNHQQRTVRRVVVAALVAIGIAAITAGIMGWL